MDLVDLLRALWRNVLVLLPLLMLSLTVAALSAQDVRPIHQANGSLLLLGTRPVGEQPVPAPAPEVDEQAVPTVRNFYADDLSATAEALALVLNSSAVRDEIVSGDLSASYLVSASRRNSILEIHVEADDATTAVALVSGVGEFIQRALDERESAIGVPPENRIFVSSLTPEISPTPTVDGANRTRAATLAVGLVLSCALTLAVDAVRRHRRSAAQVGPHLGAVLEARTALAEERAGLERDRAAYRRAVLEVGTHRVGTTDERAPARHG